MDMLGKLGVAIALVFGLSTAAAAQCATWVNSPQKQAAEDAHVIYRPYLKGKEVEDLKTMSEADFQLAFNNWKKAYDIAPAADGQRNLHYVDGRKLYRAMMDKTTDEAKKKEYADIILRLYDEQMKCYPEDKNFLLGRKAYDMFYTPGYGYSTATLDAFRDAIKANGDKAEYILLAPLGQLLTYLYKNDQVSREDVQTLYNQAVSIADNNIKAGGNYKQYYESGKANMEAAIAEVENEVFDCAYFKKNLLPKFTENKEDYEVVDYIWKKLIDQGCAEDDPELASLKQQLDKLYADKEAELEVKRRLENPGYDAAKLQQEGKYAQALDRYREAIEQTDDNDSKAQYYYSIAFIQTWQNGQYSTARENARKAASLKPNWGKPYLLIGDMYAKTSNSCGDAWDARLAILAALEKYRYAKSIDSEVAGDANERIRSYSASLPSKDEGFMRGVSAGQQVKVSCWIGETVTMQYQ